MKNGETKPLGKKKYWLLGLGFLAGLFLLLYGSFAGNTTTKSTGKEEPEAEAYRTRLAEEIRALCTRVDGVGNVTVLVSLEGGYEYVYVCDKDGKCVTVGSGSGREAVVEQTLPPRIGGIGIVCDGGDNAALRQQLTLLLSAALGIGANKIFITS